MSPRAMTIILLAALFGTWLAACQDDDDSGDDSSGDTDTDTDSDSDSDTDSDSDSDTDADSDSDSDLLPGEEDPFALIELYTSEG
jgi:hypothetical protein